MTDDFQNFSRYQMPPINNKETFEDYVVDYFNAKEGANYDKFGRNGQEQHGLDIYSVQKSTVIQCKWKALNTTKSKDKIRQELIKDLKNDFSSFIKFNESQNNVFTKFIFSSTFENDTHIQTECINLSTEKIAVEYYYWGRLSRDTNIKLLQGYFNEIYQVAKKISEAPSVDDTDFEVDRKQPILQQIYDYLKNKFKEIQYLPKHLYIKKYPFQCEEYFSSYSQFTLTLGNENIVNFFKSVVVDGGDITFSDPKYIEGVEDYETKTRFILKTLTNNAIYFIDNHKIEGVGDVRYFHREKECHCGHCMYRKMLFSKAFVGAAENTADIDEIIRNAYTYYKLGDYLKASEKFIEALDYSASFEIKTILILYNLTKLQVLLKSKYRFDGSKTEFIQSLQKYDAEFQHFKSSSNNALLQWLRSLQFFYHPSMLVNKSTSEIRNVYYSESSSGIGARYVQELIEHFIDLDIFLNGNFVIFDCFTEYETLFESFLEGLIAGHANNGSGYSSISHLDDYLLTKFLFHGKSDVMKIYLKRYKVDSIRYKQYNNGVVECINNFLVDNINLSEQISSYGADWKRNFYSKYSKVLENIITLLSYCDFEQHQLQYMVENLINFLDNQTILNVDIDVIIYRKGHQLHNSVIKRILLKYSNASNKNYYRNEYSGLIAHVLFAKNEKLKLTKTEFSEISKFLVMVTNTIDNSRSLEMLYYHYLIVSNKKYKSEIWKLIEDNIYKNFNADLYYLVASEDLIAYNPSLLKKLLNFINPSEGKVAWSNFHKTGNKKRNEQFDKFFNLAFKYNINLKLTKYNILKGFDPYYDWLLDIKGFDYNNFDIDWVTECDCDSYYSHFKKYPYLKNKVREYITNDSNPKILQFYFKCYGSDVK